MHGKYNLPAGSDVFPAQGLYLTPLSLRSEGVKPSLASRTDLEPRCSTKHNAYEKLRKLCSGWVGKALAQLSRMRKRTSSACSTSTTDQRLLFYSHLISASFHRRCPGRCSCAQVRWGGARTQGVSLQFTGMLNIQGHQATNCCQVPKEGMVN